ncbi:unnamed protein product [Rhizophagus irregularis]|nr:unnamed protein product [Rhizophagus irregularis]
MRAGSLHNAALTSNGKIVTWGINNDHSTLGCFTESPKLVEAKLIFERGNYNIVEKVKPVYAEGLDNVSIVKVVCGDNATFTISDQGHLYAIRQEWTSTDYALALTSKGYVYTSKHIVQLYSSSYYKFAINNNRQVWVFGLNNIGQCSLDTSKQAIIPLRRHSFFNKIGQKVEEFAASEHHTLAHMQNEQVFSFE